MAGHNVVIAVLPDDEYGLSSATAVAKDMLNSFPNVRVGLMVGIGGGAPSAKNDIRLGGVVVSSRQGETDVMRTAVSGLKSKYEDDGHQIEANITAVLDRKPRLRRKYGRPEQGSDRLYKSDVVHPQGSEHGCEEVCGSQTAGLVQRCEREKGEDNPVIHHGVIASANQLMKDAIVRDTIAKEKGVMCFEMEAAGLMNHFPCLVVRGICDYSDSHKSKEWQGYAAMTAAAYTKDLLTRMVPSRVEQEDRIRMILAEFNSEFKQLCKESKITTDVMKGHLKNEEARYLNKEHRSCHQVFKTSTYEQFKNINPDRVDQTCQWALSHPLYRRWRDSATDDLLWISADPGCGKSVLSKLLVDQELPNDANDSTVCYFFFKDNEEQNSLATGLCALLHQLFQQQPHLLQHAVPAWNKDGSKLQQETDELWRILLAATSDAAARNTTCVLDALDECRDRDRGDLIAKLARFHEDAVSQGPCQSWLKFIVTSRPYDDIQRGFEQIPASLPAIRLRGEQANDQIHAEINRVIHVRVSQLAKELGLRESTSVRIEQTLLAMEHRTYLWLHLAIDDIRKTLQDSFRPDEEAIESVPSSVEGAYEKILARVAPERRQKVKLILQIILGARRPLAVGEMALALGLATSKQHRTCAEAQLDADHLSKQLRHWCGLFVFVNHSRIYLIHQTAREFLVARQDLEQSKSFAHNIWRHCVQQMEMEQTMTSICIRCLNLEDCEVPLSDDIPTDLLKAEESRKEFIEYCCEWWTAHYSLSQDASEEDTFQGALALYNTEGEAFKFWFDRFWTRTRQYDRVKSMTPIRLAALSNHSRVLEHYLDTVGVHVDASDEDRRTALYWASKLNHDKMVQMLLDRGADINAQGGRYGNALYGASCGGHNKMVQMLLDRGADVNAQGGQYGNALQAASLEGHDEMVQTLLDRGADVNAEGGDYGNALQAASYRGHDKIVQMLLDRGADVNAQGGEYGNALQAAWYRGHDKIVQMLLDRGADVNAQGGRYGNALQAASDGGHDKIVQMLLDRGADVDAEGGQYGNALLAASARGHDKIVQMLLDRGADVDAEGGQYGNALQAASASGRDKMVQMLLDRGARPTAKVLFSVLFRNLFARVELLVPYLAEDAVLERDADHGKSPLHWAAELGYTSLTNRCLGLGADVDVTDKYGMTALHYAAENGHLDIAQILVQADANRTIVDSHGRTALDCAQGAGPGEGRKFHPDIVAYLQLQQ
ncbi:purine and uridine phosphorylase, partial [Aureobasidium melanogenum]